MGDNFSRLNFLLFYTPGIVLRVPDMTHVSTNLLSNRVYIRSGNEKQNITRKIEKGFIRKK
jgi:hypothetical protein